MSWTDDEIDKVFGEASDRQTFEYRPEYWKDIEKQLPVNKTRKPLFWWITGSAFVIGFLSLFFLEVQPNDAKIAFVDNANNAASSQTAKSESATKEASENETIETTSSIKSNLSDVDGILNTKQQKKYPETVPNISYSNNIQTNATTAIIVENEEAPNSNDENQSRLILQEKVVLENNTAVTTEEQVINEKENTYLASLPLKQLILEQITTDLVASDLQSKKQSNLNLFVEVNGALGQAWVKSDQDAQSVNGSLGIVSGVVLPINTFILSAGLGFQATKLGDLNIKERTTVYGFGSTILENTYQINSIYSVNLPISIAYTTGRHAISVGVNTSMHLFTGLSRTQSLDGNQTEYSKGIANTSLFNRFGIQPSIGYGFYINENVQIGVRANVQVMQPIQSDRFIGTPVKMPMEGQFYMKRTINFLR